MARAALIRRAIGLPETGHALEDYGNVAAQRGDAYLAARRASYGQSRPQVDGLFRRAKMARLK